VPKVYKLERIQILKIGLEEKKKKGNDFKSSFGFMILKCVVLKCTVY
jgi:hypothetical protein